MHEAVALGLKCGEDGLLWTCVMLLRRTDGIAGRVIMADIYQGAWPTTQPER
jgi:hypothetical protein